MSNKPSAVIVDMDGTLALVRDRSPYHPDTSGDEPNAPVIEVTRALHRAGHQIVIVSGRQEASRRSTEAWLTKHLGVKVLGPYMRANRDGRPDNEVKTQIFREKIEPRFEVLCVLDDRNSVVKMWRGLGLTCLQVAPGNF